MTSEIVKRDWDREQDLLGLARDTPEGQFARGGLAVLAVDPGDQFPDGQRAARELLSALRQGPPWPTPDTVMRRPDGPQAYVAAPRAGRCPNPRPSTSPLSARRCQATRAADANSATLRRFRS